VPTTKKFTPECHAQFATLSGDFNPMHMDVVAARRTQAGAPVVHGVHTLLWLLDCVARQQPLIPAATTLKAHFRKIVYVGDCAEAEILQITVSALRARVLVDGVEVVSLVVGFVPSQHAAQRTALSGATSVPPPVCAADLSLEQMAGRSGRLRFATDPAEASRMFPRAAEYLGRDGRPGIAFDVRRIGCLR
jgi:acyl dehydratase